MISGIENQSELLRNLFENSPLLYVLWDPGVKKFFLNPYAEKVVGWTTHEANSIDFMAAIYPEASYRDAVTQYMQSLEQGYRELILKSKSGEYIPISWANMKLGNDIMVGIGVDLREQKRGEKDRADAEKLRILNDELKIANTDLQQFAYITSNDLSEQLRMVSGFIRLFKMKYDKKLDEEANEYINYIVAGSKRMNDIISGIHDYYRVQSKGDIITGIDMNTVIDKVRDNLQFPIERTGAIISCEKLPVIMANQNQMIRLVQNIVDNAIKFCREKPVIKITCKTVGNSYIFSITDNGIGIDPCNSTKIFRMFQRLQTTEYPGTGMGLAICRKIIEKHAGRIWVESKPSEGSVFYFSIPC